MKVWTVRYAGICELIGVYDSEEKANGAANDTRNDWQKCMGVDIKVCVEEYEVQ